MNDSLSFVGVPLQDPVFIISSNGALVYHTRSGEKRKIVADGSRFYKIYSEKLDCENRPYWNTTGTVDSGMAAEVEFYEILSMLFSMQPKG